MNKKKILKQIAFVFLTLVQNPEIYAQTSAESINPFNQFTSGNNGVNLFTGDVALPQDLYTLSGRNGMDVNLSLQYSSNVFINVLAENDLAPTGWLGLGWQLSLGGYIKSEHKNTYTTLDDEFFYVSPRGVHQRILENNGKFFLEKDPYWKVEPVKVGVTENAKRIIGWILIDPNGMVYRYGDHVYYTEAGTVRNATRYTYSWSNNQINHVGEGFDNPHTLYAYQWDLAEIEDLGGNKLSYEYNQTLEHIKFKDWTSAEQYTKASYLRRITNPEGGIIEFSSKIKHPKEVKDPKNYFPEPDVFMEFYEDSLLQKIEIKNRHGSVIRKFEFCYKIINDDEEMEDKGNYYKSLLTKIVESDGDDTSIGNIEYSYYDDFNQREIDFENPTFDYNYGALKEVKGKLCGTISFEYKKQTVDVHKQSQEFGPETYGPDFNIVGGQLENGKEYIAIIGGGSNKNKLWIYNLENGQWKPQNFLKPDGTVLEPGTLVSPKSCEQASLYTSKKYFIVESFCIQSGFQQSLYPVIWDGKNWQITWFANLHSGPHGLRTEENYFILYPQGEESEARSFTVYNLDQTQKIWKKTDLFVRDGGGIWPRWLSWHTNKNNILVTYQSDYLPGYDGEVQTWRWNGNDWISIDFSASSIDEHSQFTLGENFIAEIEEDGVSDITGYVELVSHEARAWNWNGVDWTETLKRERLDLLKFSFVNVGFSDIQAHGTDYWVARYDDQDHVGLFNWNGKKWERPLGFNIVDMDFDQFSEFKWSGFRGKDYFVATYPGYDYKRFLGLTVWVNGKNDFRMRAYNRENNNWKRTEWNYLGVRDTKHPVVGDNYIVQTKDPHKSWVWNGNNWKESKKFGSNNIKPISNTVFAEIIGDKFILHRKFQNSLTQKEYSYVVEQVRYMDPIIGETRIFSYEYSPNKSTYDTRNGTAKFNQVTVKLPSSGKNIFKFFNSYENFEFPLDEKRNEQKFKNENFLLLDGLVYQVESYDVFGKLVSSTETFYEIFNGNGLGWHNSMFQARPIEVLSKIEGVSRIQKTTYNDVNGQVSTITNENSGGQKLLTEYKYAFEFPLNSIMGPDNKNMINQLGRVKVSEVDLEDEVVTYPLRASGNIWIQEHLKGPFLKNSLAWKVNNPKDATYTEFNGSPTQDWELTRTNWYNEIGQLAQTQAPTGVISSYNIGHNNSRVTSTITNAQIEEVAVLTGDYEDSPTHFDFLGGWLKNESELSNTQTHYGEFSIFVGEGNAGPSNLVTNLGKSYVFSAWVYPITSDASNPIKLSVFQGGTEILPNEGQFTNLQPGSLAGWQFISRTIPSEELSLGQIGISVSAGGLAEFYVDDVRFFPENVLVTTHYYSELLGQEIASVSENNNASFVEYDASGRVLANYAQDLNFQKVKLNEANYDNIQGCVLNANAQYGKLSSIDISAGLLNFESDTYLYTDIKVPNTEEYLDLVLSPFVSSEKVALNINDEGFVTDCCGGGKIPPIPLNVGVNTIKIQVGSGTIYELQIERLDDCWSFAGDVVSDYVASDANIAFNVDDPYIAYLDEADDLVHVKLLQGNSWVDVAGPVSDGPSKDITLKIFNGVPFVAFAEEQDIVIGSKNGVPVIRPRWVARVKKLNAGAWVPVGGVDASTINGNASKGFAEYLSFNINSVDGSLWIAYQGDVTLENANGVTITSEWLTRLYVKKLVGNVWTPMGDYIDPVTYDPGTGLPLGDGVADGIVSYFPVSELDLSIDANGFPIVAYVGKPYIPEDLLDPEIGEITANMVIVKKLKQGTTGGGQTFSYWGAMENLPFEDLKSDLGGNILNAPFPKRVQLSFGNNETYLSYTYRPVDLVDGTTDEFEESSFEVLEVRKYDISQTSSDNTHWLRIPEGTDPNDSRLLTMEEADDYFFAINNGVPTIIFKNKRSESLITAIHYLLAQDKWKSIGNPEFFPGSKISSSQSLSIAESNSGIPFVVVRGSSQNNELRNEKISALKYNTSCKDATLENLELKMADNSTIEFELPFQQYFTHYNGMMEYTSENIQIIPTINTCNDILGVWARANKGPWDYWIKAGGSCVNPSLNLSLAEGTNEVEVFGVSNTGNYVKYSLDVYKKQNPVKTELSVLIEETDISPKFDFEIYDYNAIVPYILEKVNFVVDYSSNVQVYVNNKLTGSGLNNYVDLAIGSNTVIVKAIVNGQTENVYTFNITRLDNIIVNPKLYEILTFKHATEDITYFPISRTENYHDLYVTTDNDAIRTVLAAGNTCPTYINDVLLDSPETLISLPEKTVNLFIQKVCPGVPPEEHLVVVHKIGYPEKNIIIGKREGTEPAGFYHFSNLEEAHSVTNSYVQSEDEINLPSSYLFYRISDYGTNLVEPPNVDITPFVKDENEKPILIIGVLKGSSKYLELLNEYNSLVSQ